MQSFQKHYYSKTIKTHLSIAWDAAILIEKNMKIVLAFAQ